MTRGGGFHHSGGSRSFSSGYRSSSSYRSHSFNSFSYNSWSWNPFYRSYRPIVAPDDRKNNKSCSSLLCIIMTTIVLIILYFLIFSDLKFVMNSGETRLIDNYESIIYDSIDIVDVSKSVKTYLIPHNKKPISTVSPKVIKHQEEILLKPAEYVSFSYYLNKKSDIAVTFKSLNSGGVNLLLFKGETSLDKWLDDDDYSEAMMKRYSSNYISQSLAITVSSADTYIILFQNPSEYDKISSQIDININRYDYNLTKYQSDCEFDVVNCHVDLDDHNIYLQAKDVDSGAGSDNPSYNIVIKANGNWFFISIIFCIVPFAVLICCGFIDLPSIFGKNRSNDIVTATINEDTEVELNILQASAPEYDGVPEVEAVPVTTIDQKHVKSIY